MINFKRIVTLFFYAFIFSAQLALARSSFGPESDNEPLQIILTDKYLFSAYQFMLFAGDADRHKHEIIKYAFKSDKLESVSSDLLPEKINCIAKNDRYIFVGGNGLAVSDLSGSEWTKWKSFDLYDIHNIQANDKYAYLATQSEIVEVDLVTKKITRKFSKSNGLSTDRIYSILLDGNVLFAGTYRDSDGDMLGDKLNKIDLKTSDITHIELPTDPPRNLPYYDRRNGKYSYFVHSMYKVYDKPDTIKMVLWSEWTGRFWQYNSRSGEFTQADQELSYIDKILVENHGDELSDVAGRLVKFVEKTGIGYLGTDIVNLLYKRKDFKTLERFLNHEKIGTRCTVLERIATIKDARMMDYLIKAMHDKNDYIVSTAIMAFGKTKDKTAVPYLLKMLWAKKGYSKEYSKKTYGNLQYDIIDSIYEIDKDTIKRMLEQGDEAEIKQIGSVSSIVDSCKFLKDIIRDKSEKVKVRRSAIIAYRLEVAWNGNYLDWLRDDKKMVSFLEAASKNKNEDPVIKKEAVSMLELLRPQAKGADGTVAAQNSGLQMWKSVHIKYNLFSVIGIVCLCSFLALFFVKGTGTPFCKLSFSQVLILYCFLMAIYLFTRMEHWFLPYNLRWPALLLVLCGLSFIFFEIVRPLNPLSLCWTLCIIVGLFDMLLILINVVRINTIMGHILIIFDVNRWTFFEIMILSTTPCVACFLYMIKSKITQRIQVSPHNQTPRDGETPPAQ
jgi:hypothetical protein